MSQIRDCRNCPDRKFCFAPMISWTEIGKKESPLTLLRILRCRVGRKSGR